MKKIKLQRLLFINVALIIFCLVTLFVIMIKADSKTNKDIYYITPISEENEGSFKVSFINELKKFYENFDYTYEKIENNPIIYNEKVVSAKTVYTNSSYFDILNLKIISGDSWNNNELKKAVISEKVAKDFFGNITDIENKTIKLKDEEYLVKGVIKNSNEDIVFLPIIEDAITNIIIRNNDDKEDILQIEKQLKIISDKPSDYKITNLNNYKTNIHSKFKFIIFVLIIYTIIIIILSLHGIITHIKFDNKYNIFFTVLTLIIIFVNLKTFGIEHYIPSDLNFFKIIDLPINKFLFNRVLYLRNINLFFNIIMGFLIGFLILNFQVVKK